MWFSSNGEFMLEVDFGAFNNSAPRPSLSKSIGNGMDFLNRHLSAKLFQDKENLNLLLEFLQIHCHKGKVKVSLSLFVFPLCMHQNLRIVQCYATGYAVE